MLTTATHNAPRVRALQARRSLKSKSLSTTNAARLDFRRQQCRGFRFGPWSSDADPNSPREVRQRHRLIRYRYMESLNRKISWENNPEAGSPKAALKAAMSQSAKSTDQPAGRYVNIDNIKSWSDDPSTLRPKKAEGKEREPIDQLFRDQTAPYEYELWKSPLRNIRNYLKAERSPKEVTPEEVIHATTAATATKDDGDFIDPITNRKVHKSVAASPEGAKNTSFTPKYEDLDGDGPTSSVKAGKGESKYSPAGRNESVGAQKSTAEEHSKKDADLNKYKPSRMYRSDAPRKLTAEEESKKYKDLDNYKPVKWNEPDGLPKSTPEEDSKQYKDLDKYKPVKWNEPDGLQKQTPEEASKTYKDVDQYGAVRWNEPDGLQKQTPEEKSKEYKDLGKYGPVQWSEPDGLPQQTAEEKSKEYDDLDKYGPVRWNEPDGLQKATPEEKSKEYKDLSSYGPVRWNEPDGLQSLTPEEKSKVYEDLGDYGPVRWSEPDGLRKLTPEEESKKYSDLGSYSDPFVARDAILEAHEAKQMDPTPRGKPLPSRVDVLAEDPSKEYKDLDQYGPVRWNEPDGLRKPTPEELSKNYEDLHMYGPVRWNEPDGMRVLTPEENSKLYKDLEKYSQVGARIGPEVVPFRLHPEEASKAYKDLSEYNPQEFDSPDRLYPIHPEDATKAYKDLGKYDPQEFDLPDKAYPIHPEQLTKSYKDLRKYDPKEFDSPDQAYPMHPEQATKAYKDLNEYSPKKFDSPDKVYPVHPEQVSKAYTDLGNYKPVRHNEPDGKPSLKSETGASKSNDTKPLSRSEKDVLSKHPGRRNRFFSDFTETSIDFVDSVTAREIRAEALRKARNNSQKHKLEQDKAAHDLSWDATAKQAQDSVAGRKLTGNYTRDFPEEFSRSWSTTNSQSKSALYPKDLAKAPSTGKTAEVQSVEREEVEMSSMDESFPSEESKLEPALDRGATRRSTAKTLGHLQKLESGLNANAQTEAKAPATQGREGSEFPPVVVKHYTSKTAKESPATTAGSKEQEPSSYKVLAYDPTMQTINIAETSSVVHDTSSPSTPADVLLRLSNPSKFLPHFGPLEAEGYDIIAGSGDVLVFRKARAASATAGSSSSSHLSASRINPVDMMGKPAVGNFASPTGFVNYNTLEEDTTSDKPEPPFRSNIDVRREEPVFSGQRQGRERSKKKRSLGRKMVLGTVWVAGTAYAVGVLGEYFATSGLN